MASAMFGWDWNYKLVENDITKKEDVLVALIHWYFIKFGFKCIGLGDSKTLTPSDVGRETLPDCWSAKETYALRYVHNKDLYILKGTKTEGDIVFNLVRVSDLSVSLIHFNVEDTVKNLKGDIETLVPKYRDIITTIQKDLLDPVVTGTNKEATTQTSQPETRVQPPPNPLNPPTRDEYDDPLRIGQPRRGIGVGFDPDWDPLSVGRSDLDPFSRGGGMVFNPFGRPGGIRNPGAGIPGGLPRGSVPPGARFDPFGPPDIDPGRGRGPARGIPDPDHLPPPGYDDMFM
ncbi:proteasome inhibitor PI31 subunit isoform X2 [Cryptotermes secundus]|uniref:proteasome inhibitor PI31 subunit isoform X2 n=1 Tax=Cryptotermes secundus TaxID=105785 RepID=UPI000CD7B8B4|nr:proteasome inhibitor PI31 subunit isoform X2 [Cryptotermes secundus]